MLKFTTLKIFILSISIFPIFLPLNEIGFAIYSVNGRTLYVGGDGPNNYTRIQDAINDANDGDTIFVYNGVYFENLVIDKSVSLIGENKKATVIDGMRKNNTILIISDNVSIEYFTIKNGSYAGIYAKMVERVVIKNNIVINNSEEGISLWWCNLCIIYGNTVKNDTWGICLYGCYFNIVSHNNLIDNEENMHIYHWKYWPLFWTNRLSRNYWDNWIGIIPKPIIVFFYPTYPLIQFDWMPLLFPYRG